MNNNEIKKEVANRITRLGPNEWRLGYARSETKSANEIVEFIEEYRKPFAEGRVADLGGAVFARPEVWEANRAALETEKLNEEFRSIYKAAINGSVGASTWLDGIAAVIVTANLRKEVLDELASELEAELSKLTARQKALAKRFKS